MDIWTVDAFTSRPYTGNPAAVTIVNEFPVDATCINIAMEMNLPGTAFLKSLGTDTFHIRWFAPGGELKLCGHATLAATHVLFEEGMLITDRARYESLSGHLEVVRDPDGLTLNLPLQRVGQALDVAPFKQLFGDQVIAATPAYEDLILEFNNEKAVREFVPDYLKIMQLDYRGLIITAKGELKYDFVSRFFAPKLGLGEDFVTGSAHCKLADYWRTKLRKDHFLAYQASRRGGEMFVNVLASRVHLTGKAVITMKGTWTV